jgi:hypothetical protein
MGVRKYMINRDMTGDELVYICDNVLKAFIGLSFCVGDDELKIKDKSPKSAKGAGSSSKEDAELKIDFCKIKTKDKKLVDDLIFDSEAKNAKKIEIVHDFIIDNIIFPPGEKDFSKIRELAKRKGKIIRKIKVDEKEYKKEIEFEA